jgi:hypothetical protein
MIFDPRYQPTRSNIMGLATEYLRTPYKVGTAACADWEMEEAGERLVNGGSMPSARITSRNLGRTCGRDRAINACGCSENQNLPSSHCVPSCSIHSSSG